MFSSQRSKRRKRRAWARDCRDFIEEEWSHIIWSDECYVYVGYDQGTVWVVWRANEEYDENCVIPTFEQSSLRVIGKMGAT